MAHGPTGPTGPGLSAYGTTGPAGPVEALHQSVWPASSPAGFTGPRGPVGPEALGTDIDWIPLGEVVRDGEIVVRKTSDRFVLKFRCRVFTAGIANYGPDGWKFFIGRKSLADEKPPVLLARAIFLEAGNEAGVLADDGAKAESFPLWEEIVHRVERLWSIADVMMT